MEPRRGFDSYEDRIEGFPGSEVAEEREGAGMLYSSGTTGRPKGVKPPLSGLPPGGVTTFDPVIQEFWKMGGDSVFLLPGPLYHAAPLFFALKTQGFGGTVVCMERFDAAEALSLIERHRVTHSQWVPTMFVRMMRLPARTRHAFDLSTHAVAIHGAAPCPVPLKERMIEWWGPIISEFYAGTERNGMTLIDSEDWLRHKGSVGRPVVGAVTILDDAGVGWSLGTSEPSTSRAETLSSITMIPTERPQLGAREGGRLWEMWGTWMRTDTCI